MSTSTALLTKLRCYHVVFTPYGAVTTRDSSVFVPELSELHIYKGGFLRRGSGSILPGCGGSEGVASRGNSRHHAPGDPPIGRGRAGGGQVDRCDAGSENAGVKLICPLC